MAENALDQSLEYNSLDQFADFNQNTTQDLQQDPPGSSASVSTGKAIPINVLSQSSLFVDNKGKPLEKNPKARASAAMSLLNNTLPTPQNMEELVAQTRAALNSDPLFGSGARSEGIFRESSVKRFDDQDFGFIPGIDNDDFYGKNESWYETAGKGLFRLPVYVGTKALQGFGFLGGLISPWNWGSEEGVVSKAADNSLYKVMESFDDYTKNEWMPTFQEAADRDKGFFNRMFTDGDFWTEDAVDGAAFMVSAFIPGMALSKLGLGAASMRAAGSLTRLGAAGLGTTIEGAETIANYFTNAQKLAKGIDQFNSWALATASESMFEAKEVRDKVRESLKTDQYGYRRIKDDGTFYTDAEINKIAGEASRNTFLMNAGLLGATNIFQMKYFFKGLPVGGIKAAESLAEKAALESTESALKYYGKIAGGGIVREGFIEENMQLAIQRINERYGDVGKVSRMNDLSTYSDLLNQYTKQTWGAIKGDDKEAAMNIGLGGLLGGGSNLALSRNDLKNKKLNAEATLNSFTEAQNNWLKFGNIYKTEKVKTKDENGNEVISERIVLDKENKPEIDELKLHAAVTGLETTVDKLTEAENTKNKLVKDYLRVSAFGDFVQAHINAGLESTLIEKLDNLKKATPEDLAKLGFVADENFETELNKHKSLAATIIKQNKILNDSILFDNSKEDKARKYKLTELATNQAVNKYHTTMLESDLNEIKNETLSSEVTSLSDSMVDQLNELKYRIESQKAQIESIKTSGRDAFSPIHIYEKVLEDLEKSLNTLEQQNPETIASLKKDENGFYVYEKEERNDPYLRFRLDSRIQEKGALLNDIKTNGLFWAFFADNKDGKKNYTNYFNGVVNFVDIAKKKQQEEEAKIKEEAEKQKNKEDKDNDVVDETSTETNEPDPNDQPPGSSEQSNSTPITTEQDPGLDKYLRDAYENIKTNTPEFKLDYDTWVSTGLANYFVNQYNKKFGKNESIIGGKQIKDDLSDKDKQDLIDSLSLVDTNTSTLRKAMNALKKVFNQIKGDDTLVDKLIQKISEVKDDFAKSVLRQLVTGKQESDDTGYVSLSEAGVYVNNQEHIGYDKVSINKDELATGFVLKGDSQIINSLASDLGTINDRVRVIASRKYVKEVQDKIEKSNIPNRTTITYETPNEIANKLKRGQSVIAVASKGQGFSTQIFNKDLSDKNNIYVAGIENYAIVHPDNSTEAVTFSEDQREFIKANVLVDGNQMTDEQFDRLQKIYNKLQEFNKEVELVLGENEEMDITPIFNLYFTVTKSGRIAEQGESFESLIKKNPGALFTVMVENEAGEITEKNVPLVAMKYGTSWKLDFVLNSDDSLVYTDESGEVLPVSNRKNYINEVHGINPEFNENYPGVFAWVAKVPSDPKGYKPYTLKRDKGSEPVEYFKKFATEFKELKAALEAGVKTNEFKYKGQTFSTVNDLMRYFNMNVYGFYRAGEWITNIMYNYKTKKFAFELRPADKQKRSSLTNDQRKALDLYFSDAPIMSVQDSTDDAAVTDAYNNWVKTLIKDLGKLGENLAKSDDPVQRELRAMLDSKAMFYYEMENDKKSYLLKLVDKRQGDNIPVNFLKYAATTMTGNVTVALNEEPVAPTKKPKPKSKVNKAQGFVSMGTLNDSDVAGEQITPPDNKTSTKATSGKKGRKIIKKLDVEAPFMLRSEEEYQRYTQQSYNEEIQWLTKALKNSGISLRDLGTIIDNLSAKKQVLGYYKNRAIYVSQNLSAKGSIYHEAFHGLFRDIFTSEQRAFYISKAKRRMGSVSKEQINEFRNDRGYFNKNDQEIVDLMTEEYLAEGFRKYKLDQKEPGDSWFKKFVKLFERILNFFNGNQRAIDALYKDFDGGVYAEHVANPENSISKEGVYALAYGRPKLVETEDEETGEVGFGVISKIPLNLDIQNEVVSKLTYRVANMKEGSFSDKFNRAVEELKSEYNIEALVASGNPELADAIRNKYQNRYNEVSYILGVPVRYVLDDDLVNDEDANEIFTEEGEHQETQDFIKDIVRQKIENLGLDSSFESDEVQLPKDEEEKEESDKGGEFDKVHINPLKGLSREFRSLFSVIPYVYDDAQLGIKINKTADGNMLFNAMIKVASDKPLDQILPSLDKAVKMMEEDNDPKYAPLKAFADFIQRQFGIADLTDPTSKPTRNLYLYKQFVDTFFVTELPSYVIKSITTGAGTVSDVYDASINQDIKQKKEAIKFYYEQAYRKMNTDEQKKVFNDNFKKLQQYINQELFSNLKDPKKVNNRKVLNGIVNEVKQLMDDVNIILPKGLIRQSLLAIYNIENEQLFNPNSKQNISDMETDQRLMKEGAYLQGDFFNALSQIKSQNYQYIFSDTRDENINVGSDKTRIDLLNKILKKASKYIIKYDINSAISVYQNAENENIYRYTRYTPPALLTQTVREKGIEVIADMYPVLASWMADNKLFNGSLENNLFLENLYLSSFGGFRQEIGDNIRNGVTFGSIDRKALHLSSVIHFMNREKIAKRIKNENGKIEEVSVVTFKRSRTQEEATTTNFLLTAKYQRYVNNQNVNAKFVEDMIGMLRQEYNRIQREWADRNNPDKVRYNGYNNRLHPVTGQEIEGDSYAVNGKTVQLRAYQFENFKHFFDQQNTTDENSAVRQAIKDALRESAKQGISFEEAVKSDTIKLLPLQIMKYMDETFQTYIDDLTRYGVISKTKDGKTYQSDLLPKKIKEDFNDGSLEDYGYSSIEEMLKDFHLNVEMNKRMVNQIYDGDIATGIKTAQEYYKRNKSGVISGNSMKTGYFRTAVINNLKSFIPVSINPLTGENDFDLTKYASDEELPDTKSVDIADGQSYHTMNHRIRMMDNWGRLDVSVKELLHKAKYKELIKDEIDFLESHKVVLNTIKTATGGILEYYKLSEHLINRVDVSRLVVPEDKSVEDVEYILDGLYSKIETLEDKIVENPNTPDAEAIEQEIADLYAEVHSYWAPKRGREKLHFMLNSMEASGIDQLFDPNASKKTTLIPVNLNKNDITNLKPSKSYTSGMFKFMQVETSGVKNRITLPSQARQLLTTYINKLNNDKVYRNKTLQQLAQEYSDTLGDIAKSNTIMLDKAILDSKGNLNVSQLFNTMYNGLKKQGADSNTLKYFEVRDGKPVHNPNLPAIKKIFTYYYFSMFNDAIFSQKVSGRSDILVSEYGYEVLYDIQDNNRIITQVEQDQNPDLYQDKNRFKTRPLGISVEKVNGKNIYTVEVMIHKFLSDNPSEKQLFLDKLTKFFSTRIPTEDKRSMLVAKVVDYLDGSYQNSIVVPQLVHILAGSDLDVDKLYSHTFEHYIDYAEEAHVYGDYSKYATESQGQFAEYIQYMVEHPAFKELVQEELKTVSAKPVFTADFLKVAEQLGISTLDLSADEIKQKAKDIRDNLEILEKSKKDLQAQHDMMFSAYVSSSEKLRKSNQDAWINKRAEYLIAKDARDAAIEELRSIKSEIRKMENTLKIAAVVNVLKAKNMPVTQSEYSKYIKSNPTPVIPILNNLSLQQKIDILSNEKVFNEYYINERSTVEPFKQIAASIGASVDSVITQNSIYSTMGDVVANDLNSSNKDGIGIAASFNKFLAFAEKNGVSLGDALIYDFDENNLQRENIDFSNTSSIRRTGQTLGMFADAAKEPIPSVLNLNPDTSGVSNVIMGMTGNLQMGLLINKIPFIEDVVERYRTQNSAAQDSKTNMFGGLKGLIKGEFKTRLADIEKAGRLTEIFEKDDKGEVIYGAFRKMFIKTVEPNSEVTSKERKDVTLTDLGLELYYEDGTQVVEDVAQTYLANMYANIMTLNSDILLLGRILNLIKKQNPDFGQLDEVLAGYEYFVSGTSMFGESIAKALKSSKEYGNLIKAAVKMSDYSRELLIERSPLFSSIRSILGSGLNNTYGNDKAQQEITDQIGKFVIINKIKADMKSEIESLEKKTDDKSKAKLEMLQDSFKYFTADFWLNNNTLLDDLDYLYNTNPGNPFVEFLKINSRNDINYLESTSRMKLDKDLSENIINGYESLQKSRDPRTLKLSRQMFYYLLAKDGLGYGAYTFIKYINPDIQQMSEVSKSLDEFQKLLKEQRQFIALKQQAIDDIRNSGRKEEEKTVLIEGVVKEIYDNYTKLFDKFFNNSSRSGQFDWINGIVNKIFSYAGNQKYIRKTPAINLEDSSSKNALVEVINAGVFSHIDPVKKITDKKFNYLDKAPEAFSIDFSKIKDKIDLPIETLFPTYYVTRDLGSGLLQSVNFKVLLSDGEGNLYKLAKIDGKTVSKQIAYSSINGGFGLVTSGLNAEYVKLDIEGTNNLFNFGFSKADGVKLYEKVRPNDELDNQSRMGADPSVLSSLSDTKTKQEIPSKYEDIKGSVNPGNMQIIDDDNDIAAMMAKGELKGGKIKASSVEQAPNEIGFKKIGEKEQVQKPAGILITYTPTGKQQQTYTVSGIQIFNKDGQEVFKEDSVDRNKIFANLAVKEGRAVIVLHKGASYIVNKRNQIISGKTGKLMQWDENNGDLKAILAEAAKKFTSVGAEITVKEIDEIYNAKSTKDVTLDAFRIKAQDFINQVSKAGMSKSAILEQIKCL